MASLAAFACCAAGGCGKSSHHASVPPATAGSSTTTIPVAQTVLGMHFVQMRSAVSPVVASLESQLKAKTSVTQPAVLASAEKAIRDFDASTAGLSLPDRVRAALAPLSDADRSLADQLSTLASPTRRPGGQEDLAGTLAEWTKDVSALGAALGT